MCDDAVDIDVVTKNTLGESYFVSIADTKVESEGCTPPQESTANSSLDFSNRTEIRKIKKQARP